MSRRARKKATKQRKHAKTLPALVSPYRVVPYPYLRTDSSDVPRGALVIAKAAPIKFTYQIGFSWAVQMDGRAASCEGTKQEEEEQEGNNASECFSRSTRSFSAFHSPLPCSERKILRQWVAAKSQDLTRAGRIA